RLAGARLVPVPVDSEGLVVSELERLTESTDVAAVYTTPHHQYPTTVTQSGPRRQALLRLAARRRICILEDDYHHEYHFAGRPVWPLASDDPRRVVLHIGTFSKVLAPGLRIGYAVGQAEIIRRMAARRAYTDRQGDLASERALASMITGGELGGHVRRMHRIYRERRACLASALERELGDELQFEIPAGGLGLWVTARRGIDTDAWAEAALARGVLVHSARRFRFDGRKGPELRLGFARHDEPELEEAVRRLRLALRDVTRRP
ncbi:MAG TPA: PLP-dependent aminotransferase family protein, partial [Polyangiaceae bacterium]|nr:PLP-dependent aminotransferase family protein [Polyangiaceae bacterium]